MTTRAFVDGIEDRTARLVIEERTVHLPRALLPPKAREGSWVEIVIELIDPPPSEKEAEKIRDKLAADDDGGDLKL